MPVSSTAGPGRLDEDPRARSRSRRSSITSITSTANDDDLRPAHDRVAGALHAGVHLAERHDGVARERLRRGQEEGGDGGGGDADAHSAAERSGRRRPRETLARSDAEPGPVAAQLELGGGDSNPDLPAPKTGVLPITPPPIGGAAHRDTTMPAHARPDRGHPRRG